MSASLTVYCLERLTDYSAFERLCHDLMALEGYSTIEPLGGFKDKGRDAIHVSTSGEVTVFAYSVREDWFAKLHEDAAKIKKHNHSCHKLVFVTTHQPTAGERDQARAAIHQQYGWQLEIYGSEWLRTALDVRYPKLKRQHSSIFPAEFIAAQEKLENRHERRHIFMSYAPVDRVLAEWLSRKLLAEGFEVWCEHLKSRDMEAFPTDINDALQEHTFCVIALFSQSSMTDPDIIQQRNIAVSIGQTQKREFLIPVEVESFDTRFLDRQTSALTFVPFTENWAKGLEMLLHRLSSIGCPKASLTGTKAAISTFFEQDVLVEQPEVIFSNYLRIKQIPATIYRFKASDALTQEDIVDYEFHWAFRKVDSVVLLSFHQPPSWVAEQLGLAPAGNVLWQSVTRINGIFSKHLVSELLKKSFIVKCHQSELKYSPDSKLHYFSENIAPRNRLGYCLPNQRKSSIGVCGTRKYKNGEEYKYHVAPVFHISQRLFDDFAIIVRLRIYLTDLAGVTLPKTKAVSRRKHLCANWWNDDWLKRTIAVCQFLADRDEITIGEEIDQQIIVHAAPLTFLAPVGIDENAIQQIRRDRAEFLALLADQHEEMSASEDEDRPSNGGDNEDA